MVCKAVGKLSLLLAQAAFCDLCSMARRAAWRLDLEHMEAARHLRARA